MGCYQLYRDWYVVADVPPEPVWQAEPTDPVHLEITNRTEHPIPEPDFWITGIGGNRWPTFLIKDNGENLLLAPHCVPYYTSDGYYSYYIDGINHWNFSRNEFQIHDLDYLISCPYGFNIPSHEGPEFIGYQSSFSGDEADSSNSYDGNSNGFLYFDMRGSFIGSAPFFYRGHGPVSFEGEARNYYFPIEAPDSPRFMFQAISFDEDSTEHTSYIFNDVVYETNEYYVVDYSEDLTPRLDPRSNAPDTPRSLLSWIAETDEWIIWEQVDFNGLDHLQITLIRENGSRISFQPWLWPGYPDSDVENYLTAYLAIAPFRIGDHRFFLISMSPESYPSPDAVKYWWMVQLDPDSLDPEPVWCRQEPCLVLELDDILFLGSGQHPYWIRYGPWTNKLRVIDLLSGYAVIDCDAGLNRIPILNDKLPVIPSRLEQARDIPAIFIIDLIRNELIQFDLEISQTTN